MAVTISPQYSHGQSKVIDLFTKRPLSELSPQKVIRVTPELDGLEVLYANQANPNQLFSLKILCWALQENGEVVALAPWLNKITSCVELHDPLNGHWEGYYDPSIDHVFYDAPEHKVMELKMAARHYSSHPTKDIIQEIPDNIGTHAILTHDHFKHFTLVEIFSWQLQANGDMIAMAIDETKIESTPVLLGDAALFPVQSHADFKYFFQHRIANQIKANDPAAWATISQLVRTLQ